MPGKSARSEQPKPTGEIEPETGEVKHIMSQQANNDTRDLAKAIGGPVFWTIADMARDFDVTLRTLRFYEARGLLNPRREGLNRLYTAQDRERVGLILKGKRLGFTLTEIRAMIAQNASGSDRLSLTRQQVDEQLDLLRAQLADTAAAIRELEERKAELVDR